MPFAQAWAKDSGMGMAMEMAVLMSLMCPPFLA
jgi:hypothetical protein